MQVKFYGVRGSIAVAGDETRRYGGNTSCVGVRAGDNDILFDAGTGIRRAGTELLQRGARRTHLFLSHLHWDHIQGFPFFGPAFVPGAAVNVYGAAGTAAVVDDEAEPATLQLMKADLLATAESPVHAAHATVRQALAAQMTAPNFPVGLDAMRADLRFFDVPAGDVVETGSATVRHQSVDHPNGCVAWRVDHGGKSVVYATDLELAHGTGGEVFAGLVELARGADLLVFDAMYTPEEYDGINTFSRKGWGHSTFEMGAAVAEAARVRELCLFHHDPGHDDAFMDALQERARRRFAHTVVAREGMELSL